MSTRMPLLFERARELAGKKIADSSIQKSSVRNITYGEARRGGMSERVQVDGETGLPVLKSSRQQERLASKVFQSFAQLTPKIIIV